MEVKALSKTVRVPARKARLVLDLIRGKDVKEATAILKFTPNYAAAVIGKTLKAAISNATHNNGLDEDRLYVKTCFADESMTMKRWMPRAKGQASPIKKRTSHITVIVEER